MKKISFKFLALTPLLFLALSLQAEDKKTWVEPSTDSAQDLGIYDPIEPVNRGIFWFNDKLDIYALEPVAKAYDKVVPDPVQDGIGNFFSNLRFPSNFVSDLVQFRFGDAAKQTARFIVNSTVGLGGVMDVASHFGLEKQDQDFGLALASHGVGPGPYLVIPLLGPSNVRDGFGRIVDAGLSPLFYLGSIFDLTDNQALAWSLGLKTVDLIDQRADLLDAIKAAKESSLDYYLFIQSAYYQHRKGQIGGENGKITAEDPLAADPLSADGADSKAK